MTTRSISLCLEEETLPQRREQAFWPAWMPAQRPDRGRIYRWPRNRSFGDSKPRPVLVISLEAATSRSQRWVWCLSGAIPACSSSLWP